MWAYIPETACQFVAGLAPSTWGLDLQAKMLEQSATLNGKHTTSRRWLQALKTDYWTTRLSGQIWPASIAQLGAERWIQSLAESHASPSPLQGNIEGLLTTETYGQSREGILRPSDRGAYSWKMFQESQNIITTQSGQSYQDWATALRKDCLRRRKSGRRMKGKGFSYWRTPTAVISKFPVYRPETYRKANQDSIFNQAAHWRTPIVSDRNGPAQGRVSLRGQAAFSRQGQGQPKNGHTCSWKCRKLNPHFVEWLMGLPIGYTAMPLRKTDSNLWAMRLCQWQSRMRSLLCIRD